MMTEKYTSELLGIVIAQIAQTIGYSRTQSAPLELLEDILQRFIQELARDLHSQAEHANRVEPNLKDAFLSLRNLNINVHELLDYIGNVEPIPFVREVPAYPVKRSSNMNFLKPGSAETLTRPVHIFEYLPPMLPTEPTAGTSTRWPDKASDQQHLQLCKLESSREVVLTFSHKTAVKLLQDVKPDFVAAGIQKWSSQNDPAVIASTSRDNLDHDGHALREISSVVMTTGGFISPAIEGKLPEAYVPDIIDKFKGLDAPSISPPAPKTPENQKYSSNDIVDVPVIKRMASLEATPHSVENAPIFIDRMTPNSLQEVNTVLKADATSVPATSNIKAKKNKKKNLVGGRPNDQTADLSSIKAQEKAQRKALKIYHKLSKNQADGGGNIIELKKSMKNLNRGMLSALPDGSTERLQLEKLIRKQTKQRQKHLKSQKQQQQFPPMSKLAKGAINPIALAAESNADLEPTLVPFAHPLAAGTAIAENVVGLVENKEIFQTNLSLTPASSIVDASLSEEIKLASEPDRNKLNIFKKISKQKAPKPVSPNQLNIGTNLFGSPSSNVSPLITLPSGTTITPAPPAGATENVNMPLHSLGMSVGNSMATYDYMQPFGHLSTVSPTTANLVGIDMNKPKKRGRKPGGKNQARSLVPPTGLAPIPMQSPKKTKDTKLNAYITADPVSIIDNSATLALPMEPLNLSNVDQLKGGNFSGFLDVSAGNAAVEPNTGAFSETSLKFQKVKEKKDRKKSKAKYINLDTNIVDSKKLGLMDTEKQISKNATFPAKLEIGDSNNIQIPLDKLPGGTKNRVLDVSPPLMGYSNRLVANAGPSSFPPNSAALHPNSQASMMPILPLLHFPPRPGLIPSGPGLFAPNLTGFNKTVACNTGSNMMMPNPFMPFPSRSKPSLIETTTATDNKAALLGLLPLSDIHLERSYCNVAPLVPDSMKLSNQQQFAPNKLRSPHGFASDAKQSHEYSEKDISHTSPISNVMPVAKGVGLLGIADEAQTNKIDRSIKAIKSAAAATGNVGDPIEVSDDSNDDESKAIKKNQQIPDYPQAHALKSGLIQPSNLLNSGPMQHLESSHLYAMNASALHSPIPDGILFNKQAKPAALKVTQPENNLSAANPTPFNINFMGNDKFSLAGGADLIPLSRVDSGMAYSSLTVPATSLAAGATSGSVPIHAASDAPEHHFVGSLNYDDVTITPTNSLSISEQLKVRKLHKKLKKPKEGKMKRKKDKKDKVRNKVKCDERNMLNVDKPKSQDKKQKRDKKKEKQVPPDELQIPKENLESGIHHTKTMALGVPPGDSLPATVSQTPVTHHLVSPKLDLSPNQVPKLTLKLSGTPTQSLYEGDREISTISDLTPQTPNRTKREHSPELARFSPLVTRPPKPKQCESQTLNLPMATSALVSVPNTSKTQTMPAMMSLPNTQAPILSATSPSWMSNPSSTSTISASSVLLPQQLLHPSKQIPKMPSLSASLSTTIPSVAASSSSPKQSEGSQTLPPNLELNRPSSYVDADGYRIWICPACGKVDDGSAMIGCDGCDAWYHWTCVGILVAPNDNEDWFCRVCITKKKVNGSDKKKKRTKKK
ncbi:hypothetical protein DVIR88_6g0015 [Drosophila virilis]|uniref:PHD-type domain-containing protein n=1 Tax=Drosophila virilis TaxID=7244 RepID=D0Z7A9_DROVI|nr:hypothetical protein DVIR88_6g0015 [Drosophila virilis]